MEDSYTTYESVVVLRVGDAWLVGVGKGAPHGFRCLLAGLSSWLAWIDSKAFALFPVH